nr:hypothetical protein Iba_chr08bCG8780 [Ipomoea batatas]GMD28100.1 hypothetical protein Iba_chr08eCG4160 [Ipomoea batatas]GMD29312.1 hypothetical protein Iba_chr08fCG1940 [Ipomoea batatas]
MAVDASYLPSIDPIPVLPFRQASFLGIIHQKFLSKLHFDQWHTTQSLQV